MFPLLSAVKDASGQESTDLQVCISCNCMSWQSVVTCPVVAPELCNSRASCPSLQGNIPHSSGATKSLKSGTEIFCSVKTSYTHTYTLHMMIYKNNLCFTDCMNFQVYFNMEKFQLIS